MEIGLGYKNGKFLDKDVRYIELDNERWFYGMDLGDAIGTYRRTDGRPNVAVLAKRVPKEHKKLVKIAGVQGRGSLFISERGLDSLIASRCSTPIVKGSM